MIRTKLEEKSQQLELLNQEHEKLLHELCSIRSLFIQSALTLRTIQTTSSQSATTVATATVSPVLATTSIANSTPAAHAPISAPAELAKSAQPILIARRHMQQLDHTVAVGIQ